MNIHEVANLFPLMSAEEFETLKADMAEHGQREPIWTYQGTIVDGRHRYRACQELSLTATCQEWDGKGSLTAFVISMNQHRRHLTKSQGAMVSTDAEPLFAKEAKARQKEHGRTAPGKKSLKTKLPEVLEEVNPTERTASAQAGKALNVSPTYVKQAKKLKAEHPEIAEQVKQGTLTLQQAKKQTNGTPREKRKTKQEDPPDDYPTLKLTADDPHFNPAVYISELSDQLWDFVERAMKILPPRYWKELSDEVNFVSQHTMEVIHDKQG